MEQWIGKTLYYYCAGYFGSKSYADKVIEAIGKDWVVAREVSMGSPVLATFNSREEMEEKLLEWSTPSQTHEEDDEDLSDIPLITKEWLLEKIKIRQDTSEYENTVKFREAIKKGIIKNYSAGWLSMWESDEKLLKEMEEQENI